EICQNVLTVRHLTEPQARCVADKKFLAQQLIADLRKVAPEPAILRNSGADCVANEPGRLAAGVHEARWPVVAVGVELKRIAFASVDATHDEIDTLQPFE